MNQQEPVEIRAVHSYTVYHNDNGWTVVKYRDLDTGAYFSACGNDLPTASDSNVILYGQWTENPRFGKQFDVSFFEEVLPTTLKGFVSYMKTLKCRIGRMKATAIYSMFGENVWNVIETEPQKLLAVPGVKQSNIDKLVTNLRDTQGIRRIMGIVRGCGNVTPAKAKNILNEFGDEAEGIIMCEPYRLCELTGFNFPDVDTLAHTSGFKIDFEARLMAAIGYVFSEMSSGGHSCIPAEVIRNRLVQLLASTPTPVSFKDISEFINQAVQKRKLICVHRRIFTKRMAREEAFIATNVIARILDKNPVDNVDSFIERYQRESGVTLAEKQAEGVRMVMRNSFSILTGGPGTGKTTTIRAVLNVHKLVYGNRSMPVLLAPTGKAARRMSEASEAEAATIHSAISYVGENNGKPILKSTEKLVGNLFIVDEASMLDMSIAKLLLEKIPDDAKVVFVGDPDQLPSVGAGRVLLDMISSGVVPVTKLNVIYRQGADSPIIRNAHAINNGDFKSMDFKAKSFRFYGGNVPAEEIKRTTVKLYESCVKAYGLDNVVLLCPYRSKTELNVNDFNKSLQMVLNPAREGVQEMRVKGVDFREGDRVMQMKNTEIAKNGDTGYIRSIVKEIDPDDPTEYTTVANIEWNDDGVLHPYSTDAMQNVDLAYCTTVHKSQGSEYKTVLLICSSLHPVMLKRNVLYTGVTRAKENVAIIGDPAAFKAAVKNNTSDVRWTLLTERLRAGMRKAQLQAQAAK